jgi:nucleoside-diphosphate-sugar epimerase
MNLYLVVGAGPVGSTIALDLANDGHKVRVLTRSGTGPKHLNITLINGDASDAAVVIQAADAAAAIFNCANPAYHRWPEDWPPIHRSLMKAAEATGAVLVMMDNLYALGPDTTMPMREDTPMRAAGRKGAVRRTMATELLAAHDAGRLRATIVRASDFFGPGVRDAALGERVVPNVLLGKKVSVLGSLDIPHATSYMPDVARTMIAAASNEHAWGRVWQVPNSPAPTQRQAIEALASAAGTKPSVGTVPKVAMSVLGTFMPLMRELKETAYQFERPWTTDSTITESTLGVSATPLDRAAEATVNWWREEQAARPKVPRVDLVQLLRRTSAWITAIFATLWSLRLTAATGWWPIALATLAATVGLGRRANALPQRAPARVAFRTPEGRAFLRPVNRATIAQLIASAVLPIAASAIGRTELTMPIIAMTIGALVVFLSKPLGRPAVRLLGSASIVGSALACGFRGNTPAIVASIVMVASLLATSFVSSMVST